MIGKDGVGKFGVAHDGQGNEVVRGWVLAHSIGPQVLIVTEDGERHWVREDMAREATPDEIEEMATSLYRGLA